MSTEVREILDRIQRLPQPQQEELRTELARQEEQEWTQLQGQARQTAKQHGLDDAAIARAIESHRYGEDAPKQ